MESEMATFPQPSLLSGKLPDWKRLIHIVRSSLALKFPQEKTPHKPFLGLEEKEPQCLSRVIKLQTTFATAGQKTPHRVGHLRDRQKNSLSSEARPMVKGERKRD
ncbi:hypothetical protein AVEN_255965-1 [Araneus ventricosus]|uniref:Uncharacterized protein n=1 Tax=Araneus ventricosus TaxID=182803 RepID=A0A4Y2MHZ9_ARAVE|nr:hypothetical protein AVEN_255965-1 [Araneus ventricosus]